MQNLPLFDKPQERLIIALDNVENLHEVKTLLMKTRKHAVWYKAGLETMIAFGMETMAALIKNAGGRIFADLKLHDIPNTTGNASSKLSGFQADMIDVHCSNGIKAMKAVAEKNTSAIVLGITVLTSHSEEECEHIFGSSIRETVIKFASDAKLAGLDGIVCSPKDLELLSEIHQLDDFIKITPGIQPAWMKKNDQTRVTTPTEAIQSGATALVVGRAITGSNDPGKATEDIIREIAEAMAS